MSVRLLTACFLALLATAVHAAEYDVYILAGQSNMDGRGKVEGLKGEVAGPQSGSLIYYANPADPSRAGEKTVRSGWQTLAPGYSIAPGTKRDDPLPNPTFGPELSFVQALSRAQPGGNPVAIVKVTRGGTNLRSDWSPTGFMYRSLVSELDAALEALATDGHSGTVRGMLWHQGESDSNRVGQYQSEFEALVLNIRTTVKDPALPVVIGELAQVKSPTFRELQRKIADGDERIGFASSLGLNTPDKTHFDADAQVVLGQRYAQSLAQIRAVPEPASFMVFGVCSAFMLQRR